MAKIKIIADDKNLESLQGFVHEELEAFCSDMKLLFQIDLVVEEIFVNIAHYAYAPDRGEAEIICDIKADNDSCPNMTLTFIDSGKAFDPLSVPEPDITLGANERKIGGLGIFLTKKYMDKCRYEYRDGKNILTLKKNLPSQKS